MSNDALAKIELLLAFYGPEHTQIVQDLTAIRDDLLDQVEWKAKFQIKVTESMEKEVKVSRKLQEKSDELVHAKNEIAALKREVQRLEPMGEKYRKLEARYAGDLEAAAAKVSEHSKRAEAYRKMLARGKRRHIEQVIKDLQNALNQYPENSLETEIADARAFLEAQEVEQ